MKRNSIITSLVCLVAALASASGATARATAQAADSERARAAALWEEAVRAKGGRERLHSVQNLLISSTVYVGAARGGGMSESERLYALPGRAWLYEFAPHFDTSVEATVLNTERALCTITFSPARGDVPPLSLCPPTTWPERLIQDPIIYLMETRWVRPAAVRARLGERRGRQVDVIETEVGGVRVDFYLDSKTRLPFKLVTAGYYGDSRLTQPMGLTVELDEYADVNGIKMPRRLTRWPDLGPQVLRRDTERSKYRFNVAHDETIFDGPASKKVKAGDWKRRGDD